MRLLLDTHAFVWLAAGDERLPVSARTLIAGAETLALSVASVWEAEIKRAAGGLGAPATHEAALRLGLSILPVTAEHATAAAHLPLHHRDPFDRMLVAQTQLEGMVLVTKDEALRRYAVPTAW